MTDPDKLQNDFLSVLHADGKVNHDVEVTGQITGEVERLLQVFKGEMSRQQVQEALRLKHRDRFHDAYLKPAIEADVVEMTLPDKPRSRLQRYRLTEKGRHVKAALAIQVRKT